jgi:glycosyltransferase involved in cell wall biosynthesis
MDALAVTKAKVVIVMPAYNAEKTLARTVADIPPGSADAIIVVDDCSKDRTVAKAKELGLQVIQHEKNLGYGANQKTCYRAALAAGADLVVMIHPDYQYDARLVPHLTGLIQTGICDVVLGNRIRTRREALSGGMPLYKYLANRFLTMIENLAMGQNLGEWHSGLRAYSHQVLETIPWERNSDDFVFDCEFLVQAATFGFRIGDIPVPARYFDDASSINFKRSLRYGLESLRSIARYYLHRWKIWPCPLFAPR